MPPYASVVVPTFDRVSTLASAIASVQRQSVSNIEILIVGDGATRDVSAVADGIAQADARVRFLRYEKDPQSNGANVDRAVLEARGERIFYTDDDDLWLKQHVETLGPELDRSHIADSLPVSVGTTVIGGQRHLHGTLANHGNERIRRLLAEDKLKLTFDTHIAHRRSSYLDLGRPWRGTSGFGVQRLLASFAEGREIRWTTVPTATALSFHGAARVDDTPGARRAEIEAWLGFSALWTPEGLLRRADFTWHFMRTLLTEPPQAADSLASYLHRYGIDWDASSVAPASGQNSSLAVRLEPDQRAAFSLAFNLLRGSADDPERTAGPVIIALLDNVLGGGTSVELAQAMLRPYGAGRALKACSSARQSGGSNDHIDLLEACLVLESGDVVGARLRAERLASSGRLPSFDLTRLLAQCDLQEGALGGAIQRYAEAWSRRISPVSTGQRLADLLIAGARVPEAREVLDGLKRMTSHPWLERMELLIDGAMSGALDVPSYRLSQSLELVDPVGKAVVLSLDAAGYVDRAHFEDDFIFFSGWAVDRKAGKPARQVLALIDGEVRGHVTPELARPDVAAALRCPGAEKSGYLMAARLPFGTKDPVELRIFVITSTGAAQEIPVPPSAISKRSGSEAGAEARRGADCL